jgi:hypothetical protein
LKTPLPRCASDRPEAGVHPILAIFMITARTLQIHVRFSKAEFLLNEIILQDYSSGKFEANADNISRATAHGYWIFID